MSEGFEKPVDSPHAGTTALITGATGFTGAVLARRLRAAGARVRVLVRSREKLAAKGLGDLECVEGSVCDREAVDRAVAGMDTVYHLAAVYREGGLTDDAYREVHVDGTENLCRAALTASVKRFVHCSTVGVHGHIEEPPADENYRFSPGDIYQRTKLEGEQAARRYGSRNGLPVSVVRPSGIFGPEDERLLKMFRLANRDRIFLIGDGEIRYHLIHVEDLVSGILAAGSVPAAIGEVFILAGSECLTLNELMNRIAALLGKKGKITHLPAAPFQWAGSLCEKVFIPLGLNPPIYRRRVDFFTKSRAFDIGKARRVLGFEPRFSVGQGLAETAEAYKNAGWLR